MSRFRHALTPAQMVEVRARFARGEGQAALARAFGVSLRTVNRICRPVPAKSARSCLGCGAAFASRSTWNRLCMACHERARCMAC